MVERSFAWLSRSWRLNTIFERSQAHLIAFVAIAFILILSLAASSALSSTNSAPDVYKQALNCQVAGPDLGLPVVERLPVAGIGDSPLHHDADLVRD